MRPLICGHRLVGGAEPYSLQNPVAWLSATHWRCFSTCKAEVYFNLPTFLINSSTSKACSPQSTIICRTSQIERVVAAPILLHSGSYSLCKSGTILLSLDNQQRIFRKPGRPTCEARESFPGYKYGWETHEPNRRSLAVLGYPYSFRSLGLHCYIVVLARNTSSCVRILEPPLWLLLRHPLRDMARQIRVLTWAGMRQSRRRSTI